ncbi:MAG: hypothetical protein R2752_05490 [Vicinamibacterales bacterium]
MNVVAVLLFDWLRRARSGYLQMGLFLAALWFVAGLGGSDPRLILAITLLVAAGLGPFVALGGLLPREVLLLPISGEDRWRTQWTAASLLSAAWAATAQSIGLMAAWLVRPGQLGFGAVTVCIVLVLAQAGLGLAILRGLPAVGAWSTRVRRRAARLGTVGASLLGGLTILLILVVPFAGLVFWRALPVAWNEFPLPVAAATAIGLLLLARSRATPAFRARPAGASTVHASGRSNRRPGIDVPFEGAMRLVAAGGIRLVAGLTTVLAFVWLLESAWSSPGSFMEEVFSPFSDVVRPPFMAFVFGAMLLHAALGGFVGGRSNPVLDLLHHLRVLPLSGWQSVALLLGFRLGGWLLIWVELLAVHVMAIGAPASPRLDWLILIIGCDAMAFALTLRWTLTSRMVIAFPMGVFLAASFASLIVLRATGTAGAVEMERLLTTAIGVITWLLGVWMLRRTLWTRSALYHAPIATTPSAS